MDTNLVRALSTPQWFSQRTKSVLTWKGGNFGIAAILLLASTGATAGDANVSGHGFGSTQVVRDWEFGCDNLATCEAISSLADGNSEDEAPRTPYKCEGTALTNEPRAIESSSSDRDLILRVSRAYGPGTYPNIRLRSEPPSIIHTKAKFVAIDGCVVMPIAISDTDETTLSGRSALRLGRYMAQGRDIALVDARGRAIATGSLEGFRAVAEHFDAEQHRSGSTSALSSIGSKPSNWITMPPFAPQLSIRAHERSTDKPTETNPQHLKELLAADTCRGARSEEGPPNVEYVRLDAGNTLIMIDTNCGGYDEAKLLFIIDNGGRVKSPSFGPNPFQSDDGQTIVPNVYWDDRAGRLSGLGKTRALGDCGQSVEFVWSIQDRFEVANYKSLSACRGQYDYITTYRRSVVTVPVPRAPFWRPMN